MCTHVACAQACHSSTSSPRSEMLWQQKYTLTEEQRRMYSSEKLSNFRQISKILATRSAYRLTNADLVSPVTEAELAELGQFAEVAYSTVPVEFLLRNLTTLLEPNFPLEGYHALQDVTLVSAFKGTVGNLPGYLVYRPLLKQLVVATSGTSSVKLALHDLRALKHRHPSERGNVHSGFWDLYQGVKPAIFAAVRKGFAEYDVTEIVITGHSMGGSISYLLCLDLLSGDGGLLPSGVALKLAVFGSPRTGDASLVEYWRELVAAYQKSHGLDTFKEYSVKAYNDGVPALPPLQLGYRHFAKESLYLDRTRLYHIPASESEHSIFSVAPSTEASSPSVNFPRGGHNYYNGRDFERLCRRIWWLANAVPDDDGWEDRYRKRLSKNKP